MCYGQQPLPRNTALRQKENKEMWVKQVTEGKKKRKGTEVTRTCLCQTAMPQMCWSDWWEGSLCWRTSFIFPPPLGFLWQNLCHPEFQGFSLLSFVWVFGLFFFNLLVSIFSFAQIQAEADFLLLSLRHKPLSQTSGEPGPGIIWSLPLSDGEHKSFYMYSGSSLLPFGFSQECHLSRGYRSQDTWHHVNSQDSYLLYSHVGSIGHDALFVLESCQCRPITSSLIDSDVCIPTYSFTRCCLDKFRAVIHVKNNFHYSAHSILSVWKVIWRPTPTPVLHAPLHNRNECVCTRMRGGMFPFPLCLKHMGWVGMWRGRKQQWEGQGMGEGGNLRGVSHGDRSAHGLYTLLRAWCTRRATPTKKTSLSITGLNRGIQQRILKGSPHHTSTTYDACLMTIWQSSLPLKISKSRSRLHFKL